MIIGFDGSRASAGWRTGTENYSYQLLKALAKIDKKNTYKVYLRPGSENSEKLRELEDQNIRGSDSPEFRSSDFSGIPSHSELFWNIWPKNFQFKTINWLRLWTQGGLALQTFKDKLDVLFVPAHTLPLIRKPGLKTVVTVHDLGSEYLPSMHQVKQRLYLGFMQRFQLKTATKIIAVSKATKKDLVNRLGIDPEKVSVVYEGYDREKFQIPNTKYQKDTLVNSLRQYDLQPGEYFLFVGTVQPRKNLERLILAFNRFISGHGTGTKKVSSIKYRVLREKAEESTNSHNTKYIIQNTNLAIVGSKGWMSDEIYTLPKKLGIEDRVKFLGYVPEKDLPALYSGAIALTFPSLFEGFGLPILEAQACGCPVLTSNVSSMPEVAGPPAGGGAVYVNPYRIDDIVEGMRKFQISNFKFQIIKAGFENVKRFSWEKCARETLEVLEET